jgi:hypothetical protein
MIINNNKKRPKMKELSFATNWLVTKVHSVWCVKEMRNFDQVQQPIE